ncbi:MAG: helix-turn-helix domain-containing protein [Wenzhouxiangella sp.]
MINEMSINAENVRSLREARGWSQEHLAEVAGLSLRTIQRVEAEGRGSRETKLSLAAAFDVPLGRLCSRSAAGRVSLAYSETPWTTLMMVGTLILVVGLLADMNPGLLVTGLAFQISALVLHGVGQLNAMRRAAGLKPCLHSELAQSGLSVLICGLAVLLLGFGVSGVWWWLPGAVLVGAGALFMLWPWVLSRLLVGEGQADKSLSGED